MPTGPMLLISKSVRALLPYWQGPLGQLFTPRLLAGLDITEGCCIPWAADKDRFHGFDPGRYVDLLEAICYRSGCLIVTAPDVVADAHATLALFERWQPILQSVWATVNEADVDPGCRSTSRSRWWPGRPGTPAGPLGAAAGAVRRAGSTPCSASAGAWPWGSTRSTAAALPASPELACPWAWPPPSGPTQQTLL